MNNIYGLGNALVDIEFKVEESFLDKMNIKKGLMTLVEEKEQEEILSHLKNQIVKKSCGGSAANTLIVAAQLGSDVFYSCKVADDSMGKFYRDDLLSNKVKTNLGEEKIAGVTGKCFVFVTPDADRTLNTFLGITGTFSVEELVEKEIKNSQFIYIEGYLVTSDNGKQAAIEAKRIAEENGVKTSITLSDPSIVSFFKEQFNEIIGNGVDFLFCNEQEALSYSGEENLEDAFEFLRKKAKQFAVTCSERGAYLWDGKKQYHVFSPKVKPIDTNGAGDMFAGAFLYGLTQGIDFEKSGKLACECSSKLVEKFGSRLSTEDVLSIKTKVL